MKRKSVFMFIVAISILLILTAAGCNGTAGANEPEGNGEILPPVQANDFNVLAEAKVVPVKNALLSFSSPGVVEEVLVEEGAFVEKDQVLARQEGTERIMASITSAELNVLSAQQALDALYDNAELAKANAELAVAQAEIALEDALDDRGDKDYDRVNQNTLDQIYADYVLAESAVEDAEEYFTAYEDRAEDDEQRAAALSALANARKARDRAKYNLDYALGKPDAEEVAEADGFVAVAQARLNDAKRQLEEVQNGPDPDDLALAEARLKNAEAQLASSQDSLEDLELRSPFSGRIVANNMQAGEYISPGIAAAELGDVTEWKIETTDLTELNILDIEVGSVVTVNFDAIPDLELPGTVERIKPLGENRQGDITYTILINLDEQDQRLLWNMTAFVIFE